MEEYMNYNTPCTNCVLEYEKLKRKLCEGIDQEVKYTHDSTIIAKAKKKKKQQAHKHCSVESNYLKYTRLFEKGYSAVEVADMTKGQLSYIRNCQTLWRKQMV